MSYTPGPWEAIKDSELPIVRIYKIHDTSSHDVIARICSGNIQQDEANARLIAAAPEMVELLEEAIDALYDADEYVLADRIDELLKRIEEKEEPE